VCFSVKIPFRGMRLRQIGLSLLLVSFAGAQDDDRQADRLNWFYSQRMYPNASIPASARRNAILQIQRTDASARAQRQSARGAAQGNLPFALTTDAVTWKPIGPQPTRYAASTYVTAGRVNAVAIDPRDNNVVYIGAAEGGVWKTTDGGVNWAPLTDDQVSLAMGAIALDPQNPDTVYAGTGEENFAQDSYYGAGILKSTDAGKTWTNILGPFERDFIGAIAVHPTNSEIVLCAAQSGVWRSGDGGNTWTSTLAYTAASGNPAVRGQPTVPAISLVFDPTNGQSVWATLGRYNGDSRNGVYHSSDSGLTWQKVPGTGNAALPTANVGRMELALAPSSPATMYLQISNSASASLGRLLGIYKTTDAGTTWTQLNTAALLATWGGQMWYDNTIRVSPSDPNVVWSGGVGILRSLDGGATWSALPMVGANLVQIHVDFHFLAFTPDAGKLYLANDGGMFSTTDIAANRVNWTNLNTTLGLTQFYPGMSMDPATGAAIGGAQDNGTQLFDGTVWTNVTCGDGGFAAIDPSSPAAMYAACQDIDIRRAVTVSGTTRWHQAATGIDQSDTTQFISPMVIDPTNPQTLYFGTYRLWQSRDGAGQWAASPDLTGGRRGTLKAIAVAPSDPNTVYVGTSNSKVQVTTEALRGPNASWTDRGAGLPARVVTMIAVDPVDPATVYATFSGFPSSADLQGHVYKSTNAGATWTDISGNLPVIPVNDIAIDPDLPGTLYIGTDAGVMVTTDGGNSWSSLGNGLPRVVVHSLTLNRKSRVLRAGTHGRSVWEIAIPLSAATLQPAIDTMAPAKVEAGSGAFTLSVTGSGFVPGTVVRWNGQNRQTTYVDQAHLQAQIPAEDVAGVGRAAVIAFTPSTGGGASMPKNFTIGSAPQTSSAAFVNAANPTGGSQLAPLSIASLYGTNFAPSIAVAGAPPLPFTMLGTTVLVNGAFAPLFFVSPGQVNFQVPAILSSGPTAVTLTILQGAQASSVSVVVKPYAPGLFTTNAQGSGQASALIAGTASLAAPEGVVEGSRPAKRGEYVSLYCTGLGDVTNRPASGTPAASSPLSMTVATPSVTIGGAPATVQFSGLAPGYVGLYQVNAQVPGGAAPGDNAPVVLTIAGVSSNTATIAIAQ